MSVLTCCEGAMKGDAWVLTVIDDVSALCR